MSRPSFPRATNKHSAIQYGELAQLGERLVCNQEVTGSSPVFSTRFGEPQGFPGFEAVGTVDCDEIRCGLSPNDQRLFDN